MSAPVVTRFAPSPTGYLHIGGARTALFNWLFARRHQGTFLLRIEDTDRARSTPEATAAILEGLTWLGLDWDGEPISQFARADRHAEVAHQLLAEGKAYKCFPHRTRLPLSAKPHVPKASRHCSALRGAMPIRQRTPMPLLWCASRPSGRSDRDP